MRRVTMAAAALFLVACAAPASPDPTVAYVTPTPTASPRPTSTPTPEPPTPTVEIAAVATREPAVVAQAVAPVSSVSPRHADLEAVYEEAGVPEVWRGYLASIAWCESKGDSGAVGDRGASLGTHQLWRGWFRAGEDPFDPVVNARVAVRVREALGRFGGAGGWSCATKLGIW